MRIVKEAESEAKHERQQGGQACREGTSWTHLDIWIVPLRHYSAIELVPSFSAISLASLAFSCRAGYRVLSQGLLAHRMPCFERIRHSTYETDLC